MMMETVAFDVEMLPFRPGCTKSIKDQELQRTAADFGMCELCGRAGFCTQKFNNNCT